jgi:hypothetical protein
MSPDWRPAHNSDKRSNADYLKEYLARPDVVERLKPGEAPVVKDCFDDRCLLPCRKQNLGLAKDRSPG